MPSHDGFTTVENDIIAGLTDPVCLAVLPSILSRIGQRSDLERLSSAA